jgi:hypothetical protein
MPRNLSTSSRDSELKKDFHPAIILKTSQDFILRIRMFNLKIGNVLKNNHLSIKMMNKLKMLLISNGISQDNVPKPD